MKQTFIVTIEAEDNITSREIVSSYTANGKLNAYEDSEHGADLMLAEEKKEGWINVYKEGYCGHIHTTKEEALASKDDTSTCLDTIHIEWEE